MPERAALLRRVGELHVEHQDRLGEIAVREMGKPIRQATGEIKFCVVIYEFYADHAEKLMEDEPIELSEDRDRRSCVAARSGSAGIMPWNFPCYQVARFAAPNLVIGNTILLSMHRSAESSAALEQSTTSRIPPPTPTSISTRRTSRSRRSSPIRASKALADGSERPAPRSPRSPVAISRKS